MAGEYVLTERHGRAGLVTLNRPRALNALSTALMGELVAALEAYDDDPAVGAMVITGHRRAFAAGADVTEMAGASTADMLASKLLALWDRIRSLRKPVIAAVSGYALGGGAELAMMCDMIVASETAVFGQPEVNLGVIPGAGGTQRLVRTLGKALAMEVVLNDRRLSAQEALQHGLINHVYPLETYLDEALALANQIAARAPLAIQLAKESINRAFELSLSEGLAFERRSFVALFSTEDQREGMEAFLDKRKPQWKGR